ncbi:NusG domain II-containing protein [Sporomusa sphaeroides]|uniref:NusG domain II-containing protein n=1 Tax=Sporomusa sphaeroides TaxID=47679 RepID=UPI002B98F65A|nr:NusG domain II-containing protein [Sporomusa sphaeroides]HML32010.1 NusG domain II-containing protein [Sporomusa sphaeroides]
MKNVLTIADKCLIAILLVLSGTGIILSFVMFPAYGDTKAEVRVNGTLIKVMALRPGYHEEYRIGGLTEYNIVEALDGKVRIRQDDSPRQIAVQTGWISKPPQQIVCVPYRVVITLVSSKPSDIDDIVR